MDSSKKEPTIAIQLELEKQGWYKNAEGKWVCKNAFMKPVSFEDAVKIEEMIGEWKSE